MLLIAHFAWLSLLSVCTTHVSAPGQSAWTLPSFDSVVEQCAPQSGGPKPVGFPLPTITIDPDVSRINVTYGFSCVPTPAFARAMQRTSSVAAPSHAIGLRMSEI